MAVRQQYHGMDMCKPETIICDHEKGIGMLIDAAIPGDRNVIRKKLRIFYNIKILQ
jgi:hypothetical protein